MRRLTLFLILFIVVFSFTVCGIAYYTRNVIKENIENEIAHINYELSQLKNDLRYEVHLSSLEQSLFTSEIKLTLIDFGSHQTYLVEPIKIDHGPFPLSSLKRGELFPKMAALTYQDWNQTLPYIEPQDMGNQAEQKMPLIDLYLTLSYGQTYRFNLTLNQLKTVNTPILLGFDTATIQGNFYKKDILKMAFSGNFNRLMINSNLFDSIKSSFSINYDPQSDAVDEVNLSWEQRDRYGEVNYQGMLKTKHLNQFLAYLNEKNEPNQIFSLLDKIDDLKSELSFDPDSLGYFMSSLLEANKNPSKLTLAFKQFPHNLNQNLSHDPVLGMFLKRKNGKIVSSIFVDHQKDKININGVEIPK